MNHPVLLFLKLISLLATNTWANRTIIDCHLHIDGPRPGGSVVSVSDS